MIHHILIAPLEAAMGTVLSAVYAVTGSYGFGIILLSLLINVVLLPLFQLAEKWQAAERKMQQVLRPKLDEFRQAFSGEERHVMIRTLYRQAGYHPIYAMRSTVGLFLQLPFWIAGYQLLSAYTPLQGAPFLFLDDLGKPDGLLGGVNLLPLMMTALNLLGAFFYTKEFNLAEKVQPIVLAAVFFLLLYQSPAGLLLYWTFNSLWSFLRIALINSTDHRRPVSAGPSRDVIPSYQRLLRRDFPSGVGASDGKKRPHSERLTDSAKSLLEFAKPPILRYLALFIVAAVVQIAAHKQLPGAAYLSSPIVFIVSGAAIVYACFAASLDAVRTSERSVRAWVNTTLTGLLVIAFVVSNAAQLFSSYRLEYPGRTIGGIFLGLLLFGFVSPACETVSSLRSRANNHKLYAISLGLTGLTLFVCNPVRLYLSSSDFSGGIYIATSVLLSYCILFILLITVVYWLLGSAAKNGLTLLTVFAACMVVSYSAIGIQGAGVMSEFILPIPEALSRTLLQNIAEITFLILCFTAVTYVTLKHAQYVTRVLGAMLTASILVVLLDVYGAQNTEAQISHDLPSDNEAITGFSKEGNVLIVMLDGFPGGVIETIRKESPAILKEYEGFVWYPNMLTANSDTLGSIATLAGGHRYTVQEVNNRNYSSVGSAINEAYHVYIKAFADEGYEVTFANPAFAGGCGTIDKRVHCIETGPYGIHYHKNEATDAPFLSDDRSHLPLILSMVSLFKASPFVLKLWVYDNGRYLDANSRALRTMTANAYKAKEWGFLRVLARESNIESKAKTFKFVQLSIPHPPNALNTDCRLDPVQATVLTESVCTLKEIGALLARLRDYGVYDATKVVVVSDHGWWIDNHMFPRNFPQMVSEGAGRRTAAGVVQPLLLVKEFGAKGSMKRTDTFLSNADVPSIVCSHTVACRDIGPNPLLANLGDRTLTFTVTTWPPEEERAKKHNVTDIYEVTNSIFDPQNWRKVK